MFEANNTKIILHQDIDALYNRFVELNGRFSDSHKNINRSLNGITDSYRRSGGKDTIVRTCQRQSQNLLGVCDVLEEGAALLKYSRDTLRNLDSAIRDKIDDAEFPLLRGFAPGDAGDPNTQVWSSEKEYWDSFVGKVYVDVHNGNYDSAINLNLSKGWSARDEMQCVGFAWARFNELSGVNPAFTCGYAKNIGDCYSANPDLECVSDINSVKIPALAYHSRGYGGHVVCIEKVVIDENGNHIVYYTAGNEGEKDGMMFSYVYEEDPGKFEGFVQLKG